MCHVTEKISARQKVDYIFHCASVTASKVMINNPVETLLTSIDGTKNVLNFARESSCKSVVYVSSMEMYGSFAEANNNVTETELGYINPLAVRSNYPESKRLCENMCVAFWSEYGVPVKIARLSQTFGAGILSGENRVFAQFARSAIEGKDIVLHTRGLFGILFIVWGHVLRSGQFRMYLYTFNVTLFFFLLGYTFKCDESLKEFFKKRFLRTMIPYYIWSVVSILIFLLMGKYVSFDVSNASMSLWKNLIGMLYANSRTIYMRWNLPLWFIPCMNLTLVLVWLLERVRQDTVKTNRVKCRAVFCLILILVGLVIQKKLTDIKFPFQFESAVLMAAFVELGLIFKECKIVERVNKDDLYILVCALLLGTGLFFSKINGVAEVRSSNYGKYPILFVITACAMTGFVVLISYKIGGNFILEKLGQSSLPILLMHKFPILFFQSVLPKTKFLLEKPDTIDGFLCSFVVTCVSIGICYMGKNIIRSVMPIIIGE